MLAVVHVTAISYARRLHSEVQNCMTRSSRTHLKCEMWWESLGFHCCATPMTQTPHLCNVRDVDKYKVWFHPAQNAQLSAG